MSKRLQVLIPEEEFRELHKVSKSQNKSVADWVRESIHIRLQANKPETPEKRLARLLKFARFSGPSGDIKQILSEIEKGRHLS